MWSWHAGKRITPGFCSRLLVRTQHEEHKRDRTVRQNTGTPACSKLCAMQLLVRCLHQADAAPSLHMAVMLGTPLAACAGSIPGMRQE